MANTCETTFKDLQMDERYNKLARTLKMALLRNVERKNMDNGNTSTWPSISSIHCDHLDSSNAAMSIRSSRIGSEVVSSSQNLRNILHKKQFHGPSAATSSEIKFPVNHNAVHDSAMMPPPRTPGISVGNFKRFRDDNQRTPLMTMPVNSGRKDPGFSMSTSASTISCIPTHDQSVNANCNADFQENGNYTRNSYKDSSSNDIRRLERTFSRWRVMLNNKGQLIIKGTLECGKIARSKPVIIRLTPTRVQSVFKYTYHLQGNLVDERNELPEYVSGKFYNGFPDDWENVYQIWRNFVSDGSRLSFRWPTAVTDSDDDIKSEITEISFHPNFDKCKKTTSPKKRNRSIKKSSLDASTTNDENRFDSNHCNCSKVHNASFSLEKSYKLSENLSRSHSRNSRDDLEQTEEVMQNDSKKLHDKNNSRWNTTQKIASTFKDILQEDKVKIIIDNLTNKNCSIEYIKKIVEMIDCTKFVMSYQLTGSDTESHASISRDKETYRTPVEVTRAADNHQDIVNSSNRSSALHNSGVKVDSYANKPVASISGNSDKVAVIPVRRKLEKNDYISSESDNECNDDRASTNCRSTSQDIHRKSHNYRTFLYTTSSRRYVDPSKLNERSHSAKKILPVTKNHRQDSSLSEEEYSVHERAESKASYNRVCVSPRKYKVAEKDSRRRIEQYDSSISISEDEHNDERYTIQTKPKDVRKDQYDSSVSITEDEHGEIRSRQRRQDPLNYYAKSSSRSTDSGKNRNGYRDEHKDLDTLHCYPPSNSCSFVSETETNRNPTGQRMQKPRNTSTNVTPVNNEINRELRESNFSGNNFPSNNGSGLDQRPSITPTSVRPIVAEENRELRGSNFSGNNLPMTYNPSVHEQQEDSAYLSLDINRPQKSNANREAVNIESNNLHAVRRSDEPDSSAMPPPKSKTPQVRKKPVVVSSEPVQLNINSLGYLKSSNKIENDENLNNMRRQTSESVKNSIDAQPEPPKLENPVIPKPINRTYRVQDTKSSGKDDKSEKSKESPTVIKNAVAKYGNETNPKLLTAWVPAVVYVDDENTKCRLIFEGKLLNEAGHVVNRKFATDYIRRRVTPKLVQTFNNEFYQLVGDLNDTKHVVPKELLKLCHSGCPGKIGQFCERWKISIAGSSKTPPREHLHNTSVDCLDVPQSSRGRRILPPLNYWAGERVATRDNKAIYSPGNTQESLIPSQTDANASRLTDELKKKSIEKVSSPNTSKSPAQAGKSRGNQKRKGSKRRRSNIVQVSSSDSENDKETKPLPRKRKVKAIDQNADNVSIRKTRNSSKDLASSQALEPISERGSFENQPEIEFKTKLRKRPRVNNDMGQSVDSELSRLSALRRKPEVTLTSIRKVPIHDADLSEDQLSTI